MLCTGAPKSHEPSRDARHLFTHFAMANKQKQRAFRAVHVNGQTIPVALNSDLSPTDIKTMVQHRAEPSCGAFWVEPGSQFGDESDVRLNGVRTFTAEELKDCGSDWSPENPALVAALRAKGLTN